MLHDCAVMELRKSTTSVQKSLRGNSNHLEASKNYQHPSKSLQKTTGTIYFWVPLFPMVMIQPLVISNRSPVESQV